jgi:hypothetical protein
MEPRDASDEDDDYLSEKFISPPIAKSPRRHHHHHHHQQKQLSRHQIEVEARQKALKTPLSAENTIGYRLLYGKQAAVSSDPTAQKHPIMSDLLLRIGADGEGRQRQGIGRADLEERQQQQQRLKRQRELEEAENDVEQSMGQFQRRHIDRRRLRQAAADLHQGRVACEQMDTRRGMCRHIYWLPVVDDKDPSADEFNDNGDSFGDNNGNGIGEVQHGNWFERLETEEKLRLVARYLRQTHYYCQWCGCQYEGEEDMAQNCPGESSECHDT